MPRYIAAVLRLGRYRIGIAVALHRADSAVLAPPVLIIGG